MKYFTAKTSRSTVPSAYMWKCWDLLCGVSILCEVIAVLAPGTLSGLPWCYWSIYTRFSLHCHALFGIALRDL